LSCFRACFGRLQEQGSKAALKLLLINSRDFGVDFMLITLIVIVAAPLLILLLAPFCMASTQHDWQCLCCKLPFPSAFIAGCFAAAY